MCHLVDQPIGPGVGHPGVAWIDDGVFGCMSLLGCEDVCPKDLPLGTQIAFLRRRMLREGL